MSDHETHFAHSFSKSKSEKIQVALKKFKGKFYIDLRLWFEGAKPGTFVPSRKGVAFPLDQLIHFRQSMLELSKAAERLQKNQPALASKGLSSTEE